MIGELIEKLCIANIKLFQVCNDKANMANNPGDFSKTEMVEIMRKDINLCKLRAQLKNAIDSAVSQSIMNGEISTVQEIKQYGKS